MTQLGIGLGLRSGQKPTWNEPATLTVSAAGVALGLGLGGLAYIHPRWGVVAMTAAVLMIAALFTRALGVRVGLVVLLIVTSLIDRFTFAAGNFDIRAEQIAAIVSASVLVVDRMRERRILSLRPNLAEGLLLAWFALGLLSSLGDAPDPGRSVKILALYLISSLALFLPRRLLAEHPEDVERVMRWLLLALAIESLYALLTYFLHLFGATISLSVNRGHYSAYGTLWEPNVLGAISAAAAVAWAFLGKRYFRQPWLGVIVCVLASVVSFARTAWLALIVVAFLSLITPARRRLEPRSMAMFALALAIVIGAVVAVENAGAYTIGYGFGAIGNGNLGDIGNPNDVLGRLFQFQPAIVDIARSPLLGGGIDSFGERYVISGQPQHIGNLELAVANDTGLIGLLVFAGFLAAISFATWRARRDPTVLALGALALVIAITNQATETLELMITWLLIGLLLAAIQAATLPATPVRHPLNGRTAPDIG